jgi:hypothetical protein
MSKLEEMQMKLPVLLELSNMLTLMELFNLRNGS